MKANNYGFFAFALCALLLCICTAAPALAVDAVWRQDAGINGDWNNNSNWVGGFAPVNPGDTATFNFASVAQLALSSSVTIDSVTFNPVASTFSINPNRNSFSFVAAGIVNNSGARQTIVNGAGSVTNFLNNSTAANATIRSVDGGTISFFNSSTAGNAGLVARGGVDYYGTGGGSISLFDASTADNATLTAGTGTGADGGSVSFQGASAAGNATLIAEGGSEGYFSFGGGGGSISFLRQLERRQCDADRRLRVRRGRWHLVLG